MLWHRPAAMPHDSRVICWIGQAVSLVAHPWEWQRVHVATAIVNVISAKVDESNPSGSAFAKYAISGGEDQNLGQQHGRRPSDLPFAFGIGEP